MTKPCKMNRVTGKCEYTNTDFNPYKMTEIKVVKNYLSVHPTGNVRSYHQPRSKNYYIQSRKMSVSNHLKIKKKQKNQKNKKNKKPKKIYKTIKPKKNQIKPLKHKKMSKIFTKYKKIKKYKKPKIKLLKSGWKTLLLLALLSINSTSSDSLIDSHYKDTDQEILENTSIRKEVSKSQLVVNHDSTSTSSTSITGHLTKCWQTVETTHLLCLVDGKLNKWGSKNYWISHKMRNKLVKTSNGNRNENKIVKILHWNLGNKLWQNKKIVIEALILERTPDLLFISEANLMDTLPAEERNLPGYELLLPSTMEKHKCARLVLLVREGINVTLNTKMMHEDVQVIWVSLNIGRRSNMKVGGGIQGAPNVAEMQTKSYQN